MACNCGKEMESLNKYLAPLRAILKNYEKDEKYLIPILQEVQDEYGYLPEEVLKEIASALDLSLSQVYGVVTFYTQFHMEPRVKILSESVWVRPAMSVVGQRFCRLFRMNWELKAERLLKT